MHVQIQSSSNMVIPPGDFGMSQFYPTDKIDVLMRYSIHCSKK